MMYFIEKVLGEKWVIRYCYWRFWDMSCYDGLLSYWRWMYEYEWMIESVGWVYDKLFFMFFVVIWFFYWGFKDLCFFMFIF